MERNKRGCLTEENKRVFRYGGIVIFLPICLIFNTLFILYILLKNGKASFEYTMLQAILICLFSSCFFYKGIRDFLFIIKTQKNKDKLLKSGKKIEAKFKKCEKVSVYRFRYRLGI